jgi:hypothetical protein
MNEPEWLTIEQVSEFERTSRVGLYNRMRPEPLTRTEAKPLRWEYREDGRPGRLIDPLSMSFNAQQRWRKALLERAAVIEPDQSLGQSDQRNLFPDLEADKKAAAPIPSKPAREIAFRRLRIIQPLMNHDFKALGYNSPTAYQHAVKRETGVPESTQRRWLQNYKEKGLEGLLDERPGPAKGTGAVLDSSMRGYLQLRWQEGLNYHQCHNSLTEYLKAKQSKPGNRVSHLYRLPSRPTTERFLHSLGSLENAAREGRDALKAACGYIDRSYLDLASLERVESDECKLNLFSFDPRHAVNRQGSVWIRRYWLLTFYDARSMYPLVWNLCEGSEYELRRGIALDDELNLFVALVRAYGVPAAIHSDRGRFRGKVWGGEPYQQRIDKEFAPANGILQRVGQLAGYPEGVRHDMPRIHNPRGTRLERYHGWVRDWFRAKPGWIGANTRERKMTHGDADVEKHKLWCVGKLAPGERSPLLARDEVLAEVNKMMEAWRDHNSEGTDMCGLTPRAVFVQYSPPSGFRRVSEDDLAFATAQHFENERLKPGGIIELRDGLRYSHPLLIPLAGQTREVVRLRHDHSFITVLPAQKGEETIIAPLRARVGMKDPDQLAAQMRLQNRIVKIAGETTKPLEYDPGSNVADTSPPGREIGSVEYLMEHDCYKKWVKPMDFADLEV